MYLCVIPARGGSQGVPRKNVRPVGGRPLIEWSIEHALTVADRARVVVSTDDEEIAEVARAAGAEVPFLRPSELATSEASTEPVLCHAVEALRTPEWFPTAVVLLQPTSPVRAPGALARALDQFEREAADSLVSVTPVSPFLWSDAPATPLYDVAARPRRQDLTRGDLRFIENGSIYVTRTEALLATGNRVAGRVTLFEMGEHEAVDVDTAEQLWLADRLLASSAP